MIVNFKSEKLEALWTEGDLTLYPNTYVYELVEVLTYLNSAIEATDLILLLRNRLGGFKVEEYLPENWSVTITVNNVEPIGSITCLFRTNEAHNVDFNEYG